METPAYRRVREIFFAVCECKPAEREVAEDLALETYDLTLAMYGEGHLEVARAATQLVDTYEALGDTERYDFWYEHIRGTPFDPDAQSK